MRVAVRNIRDASLTIVQSSARSPVTSVRLSQLRKSRRCEQVAAVCYRIRSATIEFLLVQTRNRKHWTFPKGSAEPGLTHAQAAALEAFEEAGVHGRIEEAPFAEYLRRKSGRARNCSRSAVKALAVSAHLCEVLRLRAPKESNRNRTWFSLQETKRRLRQGRGNEDGNEFARVVDKAMRRIQGMHSQTSIADRPRGSRRQQDELRWNIYRDDELQSVPLEYPQSRRRFAGRREFATFADNVHRIETVECEVLPFGLSRAIRGNPRLLPAAKKA
jgi:8-oxo-dGTP pyrophosphatase MutT (NUDIX family)